MIPAVAQQFAVDSTICVFFTRILTPARRRHFGADFTFSDARGAVLMPVDVDAYARYSLRQTWLINQKRKTRH